MVPRVECVVILLLSFPTGPGCSVFQQNTPLGQAVADSIGRGKVAPALRRVALLDRGFDLLDRDWWTLVFTATQAQRVYTAASLNSKN